MVKPIYLSSLLALSVLQLPSAFAACTYSEAVMAFERGNVIRGSALMKMAAGDGDTRAIRYLANLKNIEPQEQYSSQPTLNLVVVNNVTSAQE